MRRALLVATLLVADPATAEDFSGFHAGLFVGPAIGSATASGFGTVPFLSPRAKPPALTGIAGLRFGYDRRVGRFVFGIEADGQIGAMSSNWRPTVTMPLRPDSVWASRIHAVATVRPRVGFTAGRWLFFGTAGVAVGDIEVTSFEFTPGAFTIRSGSVRRAAVGFAFGIGVERLIGQRISLRADLMQFRFPGIEAMAVDPAVGQMHRYDAHGLAARFGVSLRF